MTATPIRPVVEYDTLDHAAVAAVMRDCVKHYISDPTRTYEKLADEMFGDVEIRRDEDYVSGDAIKSFVSRDYVTRIHKNNRTLRALYDYFTVNAASFDQDLRLILLSEANRRVLTGSIVDFAPTNDADTATLIRTTSQIFYSWFKFGSSEIGRMHQKFSNEYVLLRKSVRNREHVVKSTLSIDLATDKKTLQVTHVHIDRHGVSRTSTGFLVSAHGNIYIMLKVEDSQGMELIALREPMQQNFNKLMGFMLSLNIDRRLLSARVMLERNDDFWRQLRPRFALPDLDAVPTRRATVEAILDEGTSGVLSDTAMTDALG